MNSHNPFNTGGGCGPTDFGSRDQLVDRLIGDSYKVVKEVYLRLGQLEYFYNFLNRYGWIAPVDSDAALKELDVKQVKYARVYGKLAVGNSPYYFLDYLYVEGVLSGILPNVTNPTGSWIAVGSSGSGSNSLNQVWYYTATEEGQTTIKVPDDTPVTGVQVLYVEGQRQDINKGFGFDPNTGIITLADELSVGEEVTVILGLYDPENDLDIFSILAASDGASKIGTASGVSVEAALGHRPTYAALSANLGASYIGGLSFISVEMFSHLANGNDWRVAIQAAIDKAGQNYVNGSGPTNVLIGGHFTVSLNPDSVLIPGEVAAGRGALCMRSGVTLMGGGSITLAESFTGSSSGAIITNWEGAADNCKIQGITLKGSRGTAAGTGITCINIVDSDNVTIDNVKALDSTSGGIYLRRANNAIYGCSNSRIVNCYVHNVGYIGIQCERPNVMTIMGCTVTSCGDNGIDIFGNVTDETGQGVAEDVVISNNTIRDVSVGVFIESCGNVAISSCRISGFSNSGVFFNRINTAAYNCSVIGCTITGKDITTSQGIRWKNAVGYTRVFSNTLKNCIDSFATTGGMLYVDIGTNNHENIGRCFLYVPKTSNGCVYTRMAQQVYNGVQTDGIPYNTTPRGWPSANNTRYYRCSFTAPYMMYSATTGEDNFIRATGTLPSNSGWGPGYSIYNTVVAGETVIAMGSSLLTAGEYLLINGSYYYVYSVSASYAVVRKWDVTSQDFIAGDYTSYLNSALSYSIFRAAWGTL